MLRQHRFLASPATLVAPRALCRTTVAAVAAAVAPPPLSAAPLGRSPLTALAACALRRHSQADRGTPKAWIDGELRPEYSSKHDRKKLNPATMPHHFQAKIQNDRREMGLPEVVDWVLFAEGAVYIPTRSGPLWCGSDDPRVEMFTKRKEKHKVKPLQIARKAPGDDPTKLLEDHHLRPYFSEPSDINDPMSVADGLYKAGRIKSFDVKHTAARLSYKARPPIVSIMGHVDHGKTTLLDYLRKSNVAAQEAGGITQSVGAFSVMAGGEIVTFIDTPGHRAFTEMRKAGALCTDVIVLVISTVDGLQPQTLEVLSIAREARLPLIIAANKIDRNPDVEPIKKALREHDIVTEDDGGEVQMVRVSALTGEGVPQLIEAIQLQAALSELSTPEPSRAEVYVLDSRMPDQTEVAGIVKCGTLKAGMTVAAGVCYATITKLSNDRGEEIKEATVSTPVVLSGFKMMPKPGSTLFQLSSSVHGERYYTLMQQVYKSEGSRETYLQTLSAESKGRIWKRKPDNNITRAFDEIPFNLSIYAATFGQLQALMALLYALPRIEGVNINVKYAEVGGPDDNTVLLMLGLQMLGAVLIFGKVQQRHHMDFPATIEVFRFDVVYHGIEWLKKKIVSVLPKKTDERVLATATCKQVFRASQAGAGNAAGLLVQKGTLHATQEIVVMRAPKKDQEPVRVFKGGIRELRRFKEIVPSVDQNLECGLITREEFAFRVGDIIQAVEMYDVEPDVDAIFAAAEEKERIARLQAIALEEERQAANDAEVKEQLADPQRAYGG
jgi:translation initiation factor IF-2